MQRKIARNFFIAAALVVLAAVVEVQGFAPQARITEVLQVSSICIAAGRADTALHMAEEEERLRTLGFTEDEIRQSKKESSPEQIKVRVDLVDGIDAFTLSAVGFGLIALNFFVFANMGDGGIAGIVATIMNTWGN